MKEDLDLDYSLLEGPMPKPKAGFQTVWVQTQLKRLKAKAEALKAQFIKPHEII